MARTMQRLLLLLLVEQLSGGDMFKIPVEAIETAYRQGIYAGLAMGLAAGFLFAIIAIFIVLRKGKQ